MPDPKVEITGYETPERREPAYVNRCFLISLYNNNEHVHVHVSLMAERRKHGVVIGQ